MNDLRLAVSCIPQWYYVPRPLVFQLLQISQEQTKDALSLSLKDLGVLNNDLHCHFGSSVNTVTNDA